MLPIIDDDLDDDMDIYLPEELHGDTDHFDNTPFAIKKREIEREILAYIQKMNPITVDVVRMKFIGRKGMEIAQELNLTPAQVSYHSATPLAKTLLALYQYRSSHLTGPTLEHRRNTLGKIMLNNEDIDPKTSIAAIKLLNEMDGVGGQKSNDNAKEPAMVVIDQKKFPRGPLDGEVIDVSDE